MKDATRNRGLIFSVAIILTAVVPLFGSFWHANAAPTEGLLQRGRVTGFPIPRFVSLDATQARLRAGPGTQYRIKWLYTREGVPLEIIAEYGNWRKVRDQSGDAGWMHHSLLSGERTAVVAPWKKNVIPLMGRPSPQSDLVAKLEPGVEVSVNSCTGKWCEVTIAHGTLEASGFEGAALEGNVRQISLWGVYPGEMFN